MADQPEIIRNASLYVKGRKVANAETAKMALKANSELKIGDGKVVGAAQGVPTCSITFTTITTVGGNASTQALTNALLNHEYIDVGLGIVDGKMRMCSNMIVDEEDADANMAKGDQTGSFTLLGGAPELVG